MTLYRKVDVKVWRDRFFLSLTDDARLLWLYLISSPQTSSCGIYIMSVDVACRDLQWPRERFDERLAELLQKGGESTVRWDPENLVIFLPNWLRYNQPVNPNAIKSYVPTLESIPDRSPLKSAWYQTAERLIERFRKPLQQPFRELFAELQNIETETEGGRVTVPVTVPTALSLDMQIWSEYFERFNANEGYDPFHSEQWKHEDLPNIVRQARGINRDGDVKPTEADILNLIRDLLDRYFASKDEKVIGTGKHKYSLRGFSDNFGALFDAHRRDRRRRRTA